MAVATDTGTVQLVVFGLHGDLYALPIEQVQEIIRYTEPREIASDVPWIEGVISLRGKIVPVCNLAARLGARSDHDGSGNIVIVETEGGTAGVVVDRVDEVDTIDTALIEPAVGTAERAVTGIAKLRDQLVVVLDGAALLAGVELTAP